MRRRHGKPPFSLRSYRERALLLAITQIGVREHGGNNRGPQVETYLRSTGLGPGWPWCMAFVHWCYMKIGLFLGGGASVGNFREWAQHNGELVHRPLRGDLGCWEFTGDGWPDHVFFVRRVLRMGPWWMLRTVEGNTSSGQAGSQGDGGGVYGRIRVVRDATVRGATFVRIPGPDRRPH